MYDIAEIKTIHLEITSKCQASCPMCVRNIQGKIENPWLSVNEITLEQFKDWFSEDFIKQLDKLYMCGNAGDPIIAKDTIKIFEYLRKTNPNIELSMNTNGSARGWQFWKKIAELKVKVRFGIDGLIDTHTLYRIGTDYDKIIENAKIFINEGGEATWDMLIFEHNQHQVDICRALSQELGFKNFITKNTSRFKEDKLNVIGNDGKTMHIIYPSIKSSSITKKLENSGTCTINCKVSNDKSLYVAANGLISPCCWLDFNGINPANQSVVDFNDRELKHPNLKEITLYEIFDSGFFRKIEQTWSNNPLRQCARQCGKVDKFNEQF